MAVEEKKPYFAADELQELHQQVKEAIIKDEVWIYGWIQYFRSAQQFWTFYSECHLNQFTGKVKLVGDDLALCFQQRMDREIDANYVVFVEQNNKKREEYTVSVFDSL